MAPAKGPSHLLDQQILMDNPLAGLEDDLEQLQAEQQRKGMAAAVIEAGQQARQNE